MPDKSRPSSSTARGGSRSAFAAKALGEMGYEDVVNLAGGFIGLEAERLRRDDPRVLGPTSAPATAATSSSRRSARTASSGSSTRACFWSAQAGSARRQRCTSLLPAWGRSESWTPTSSTSRTSSVRSSMRRIVWEPKVHSAKRTIEALNPDVLVRRSRSGRTSENADRILGEGWDVIVDGADNLPTRYPVNDASIWHGIPVVHGSIFRSRGRSRCSPPGPGRATAACSQAPPPAAPSCAEEASSASCPASSARCRRARR